MMDGISSIFRTLTRKRHKVDGCRLLNGARRLLVFVTNNKADPLYGFSLTNLIGFNTLAEAFCSLYTKLF